MQAWHLLANTLAIVSFMPAVSASFGVAGAVGLYGASIVGGSMASLWKGGAFEQRQRSMFGRAVASEGRDSLGLGASGGVFGLFTITTLLAPSSSVALFFIPLPAWVAWGLLVGVDAYCALDRGGRNRVAGYTGMNVGHEAHLGGVAVGAAGALLLRRLGR